MVDADGVLKIVLLLVLVWIGLELLDFAVDLLLAPIDSVIGLLVVVLIVLFLLDRI